MLCNMHKTNTSAGGPYCFRFQPSLEAGWSLDREKYAALRKRTGPARARFVADCYAEYKRRHPDAPTGSVDVDPAFWCDVALRTVAATVAAKDSTVFDFPNGCCTQGTKCYINLFYLVVVDAISGQSL